MGVIPSLGTRVPRLLAAVPFGFLGVGLGIIQIIGAIGHGLGFGTSPEEIGLELALLAFQLFDLLLQRGDAVEGIAMTGLPISRLLAELEILALQAMDSSAELVKFAAQVLDQSDRFGKGGIRTNGAGSLRNGRSRADGTQ
jgi:hypothetical protein